MRLGFFDDRFQMVYGAQRNMLLLAQLAATEDHDVCFYTTYAGPLADEARQLGLKVKVVGAPLELRLFDRAAVTNGFGQILRTAIAVAGYGGELAAVLRRDQREVVLASGIRSAVLLGRWQANRGTKLVLYAQNNTPFGVVAAVAGLLSTRIGLIGPNAMATFPRRTHRVLAGRCRPLASGRDLGVYSVKRVPGHRGARLRVLTVAAIQRRKGLHLLIEAVSGIDVAHRPVVTIVGGASGEPADRYLEELRSQAGDQQVDVEFAGWQEDVMPFLTRSDLFVLASYEEGLPGVLIEAMASGLACVTTEAGNAGDLVRQCEGGSVVGVGDVAGLRQAIEKFDGDRDLCRRTGERAAVAVSNLYGLDSFIRRFDAVLAELSTDAAT